MSDQQTSRISWLKIVLIPIFCYLPAFGLLWMSVSFFKPVSISRIDEAIIKNAPKNVQEGSLQDGISKLDTSELARAYIRKEIENEVNKQSQQAAKDEVEKLKADWKGDLFGLISFPVLFAIASVFAAFAVKDILTEILKEQEKNRIKQELEGELKDRIIPEAIEHSQQVTNDRIETIESYTYLLEYEMLAIAVNQIVDDIKRPVENSIEIDEYILPAVQQFFSRGDFALGKISSKVRKAELELIRKSDFKVLESKFGDICLSDEVQKYFEDRSKEIENKEISSESKQEYGQVRMENIFQIQLRLLKATLWSLQKDDDDINENSELATELTDLMAKIEKCLLIGSEKKYKENKGSVSPFGEKNEHRDRSLSLSAV